MIKSLIANSVLTFIIISSIVGLAFIIFGSMLYFAIPSSEELKSCMVTKLHNVNLCESNENYVRIKNIPKYVIDLLLASEDSNFWTHSGFDWYELKISLQKNIETKSYKRGASTISQQLAKNMFLSSEKTLIRKIKEALITLKIEATLSKKEILEKYLNIVEFGKNIYGLKAAARFYFNKTPSELEPEEAAFLIMILPNPVKYSQSFFNKQLTPYAFSRINILLKRVHQSGKLTDEQYQSAKFRTRFLFNSTIPEWDEFDFPNGEDSDSDPDPSAPSQDSSSLEI